MAKFIFLLFIAASAEARETYVGTAKDNSGKVAYLEKHSVEFSPSGKVQESVTEYTRSSGEVFGRLKSNYRERITAPSYSFEDLRDGSSHGLDFKDGQYVLWSESKDKKRKEAVVDSKKIGEGALVVGCQGLHYYLIDNLDKLDRERAMPIKYLIPGKLDYYSFVMSVDREDSEYVYLKISVQNRILRLFVSSLYIQYRKKDRRLISYEGLSNIPADNGDMQNISLRYEYNESQKGRIK